MPKLDLVNKTLLCILVAVFVACVVLMMTNKKHTEGFTDDALMEKLNKYFPEVSNEERDAMYAELKDSLDETCKTDIEKNFDINNWVPKTNIPPPGPRIDMSQYVPKSAIPPEKVCPPQKEIDYSEYVKKSTLPPAQKCPPCISPKVKVSAGLCKKCPPCPACPPPKPCPRVECPEPEPCPKVECPKCSEIKYIKVPTVITRTIKVDSSNNVVSEEVAEETKDPEPVVTQKSLINKVKNAIMPETSVTQTTIANTVVPEATVGEVETTTTIPKATRQANKTKQANCKTVGLNSDFKKFGIYGF